MYSNLHGVPTQKTFLLTQREDINHIDKSKWHPGHSKSNSGEGSVAVAGSLALAGSAVGVGEFCQRAFCLLFWGYRIVQA